MPKEISIPELDLRAGFKSGVLPVEPEPTLPPDVHEALHNTELGVHEVIDVAHVEKLENKPIMRESVEQYVTAPTPVAVAIESVKLPVSSNGYRLNSSSSLLESWKIDPYGHEHARVHQGASGSLLAAMRRHHLINDFIVREDSWYTNQTCDALLEYFGIAHFIFLLLFLFCLFFSIFFEE
jgi:hypothetical protein